MAGSGANFITFDPGDLKPVRDRVEKGGMPQGPLGSQLPGSALPIEALGEDAKNLGLEAFEARYGRGFLMVTTARFQSDGVVSGTELRLDDDPDPGLHTASVSVVVFPLRPQGGGPGHLVTLGRESSQDVVVPDPSVSRCHAFTKIGPNGGFVLHDMGSTNGTTVNGKSVATREGGPPTPLKPGDSVRLGQVEFTFTDASALRDFALQLRG